MSVLSKLECTPSKGWSLTVKVNDGTATVVASIHDKVISLNFTVCLNMLKMNFKRAETHLNK